MGSSYVYFNIYFREVEGRLKVSCVSTKGIGWRQPQISTQPPLSTSSSKPIASTPSYHNFFYFRHKTKSCTTYIGFCFSQSWLISVRPFLKIHCIYHSHERLMNFPKENRSLSCYNALEKSTLFILMRSKSQFYIIHTFAASENFPISSTKQLKTLMSSI